MKENPFPTNTTITISRFGWLHVEDVPASTEPAEYGGSLHGNALRDAEDLMAEHLILATPPIRGAEFLFLQKKTRLSRFELGKLLGVSDETIRAWAADKDRRLSPPVEAAIRLIAAEHLGIRLALPYSQLVASYDQPRQTTLRMHHPRHAG